MTRAHVSNAGPGEECLGAARAKPERGPREPLHSIALSVPSISWARGSSPGNPGAPSTRLPPLLLCPDGRAWFSGCFAENHGRLNLCDKEVEGEVFTALQFCHPWEGRLGLEGRAIVKATLGRDRVGVA